MPQIKANGLTFEYDVHGSPNDPVVLLIHGFTAQMVEWPMAIVQGLVDRGYRVVRFDNRDVGLSTHLHDLGPGNLKEAGAAVAKGQVYKGAKYTLHDMAKDSAGVLTALGIEKAHVVGASMGGYIAQLVALEHPHKVKSLTSVMSSTGRPGLPGPSPAAQVVLNQAPKSLSIEDRKDAYKAAQRVIGSPKYQLSDAQLDAVADLVVRRAPPDLAGISRQMAAIMGTEPRHEKLKSLKCPALVIHGNADPLVNPEGGKDTAASIPGAKLAMLDGVGHDTTDANASLYLEALVPFLDAVEGRKGKL
ncbi:alpha/beta hydrolase fold protein [Hyaloraphidium curvatum]|nr:alpha/beta hydrolase fold protein [Hyaloraphidium curvatum]